MSRPCFCNGLCPEHSGAERFRVFWHSGYGKWAVMVPYSMSGLGRKFSTWEEASAYADQLTTEGNKGSD